MINYYELAPQYDSRKSFYGKALVFQHDGYTELHSYQPPVARIYSVTGAVKLLPPWDSSQTTLRHVKEFLKQAGLYAGTRAELAANYGTTED